MKPKIRVYGYNYFKWIGKLMIIPKGILTRHICGKFELRIGDNVRYPEKGLIIDLDENYAHIAINESLN